MADLPLLLSVIGSRPEIIQAAPLAEALRGRVDEVLVHTGQHYDAAMSAHQIADTCLPEPAYNLAVGSMPNEEQVEVARLRLRRTIGEVRPSAVLVRGDTNATLAGARAAHELGIPLMHVEAGLRSHRLDMPEERNRIETDRLADVLFAPTGVARDNLLIERVRGTVHVTGDVLNDVLLATRSRVPPSGETGDYVLATVHRNYNTDDPDRLGAVLECLGSSPVRVIFPVHPRTRTRMTEAGLEAPENVDLRDPVTYTEMLALERDATAIATDSGGVQREAYVWGVRCITLREETEWVETVDYGWNTLVGVDPQRFREALEGPVPAVRPPVFGDGQAAERIAGLVERHLTGELSEVEIA